MRVPLSLACGAYDRTAALARGDIRPVVDREVAFEDLPAALGAMASRDTIGRVVVRLS